MKNRKRIHGDPRRNYAREWRRWRDARGWTQAVMADVLRLSLRTIKYIEGGYHPPRLSTRMRMYDLQRKYREERNHGRKSATTQR